MKKRNYLLVEILLAIFIISLCVLPIVKTPIVVYSKIQQNLQKIEYERLCDLAYFTIKNDLYQQKIPWDNLLDKNIVYMEDFSKELPDLMKGTSFYYSIKTVRPWQIKDRKDAMNRLLEIAIYINSNKKGQKPYATYYAHAQKR